MVNIQAFYHDESATISYVVFDCFAGYAIIIDSVLDFSISSGVISTKFADSQIQFIRDNQLNVVWILETHAHADHLTAAQYIKSQLGGKTAVSSHITETQKTFKFLLNIDDEANYQSEDTFDLLLTDQQKIKAGKLEILIWATPGHTSDSLTFIIGNNAFVGDTVFMPDSGTARCDFPGGDAALLYDSINRLHTLPDNTQLWMCHDYQPDNRKLAYVTDVLTSKKSNIHINTRVSKSEFIARRTNRDNTLAAPKLLYPAIQVNICGGKLPQTENNGQAFIKIPITQQYKGMTNDD